MSTYPLSPTEESPSGSGGNHGLPLTIDPTCIHSRNVYSDDDGSMDNAMMPHTGLASLSATPASTSPRPSLGLDQTPPQHLSGQSSASSPYEYSSASGFPTPYSASNSASTCSSRRDSMIYLDNPQHYVLPAAVSPSPQNQNQQTLVAHQCFLPSSFPNTKYPCLEPAIFAQQYRQACSYRRGPMTVDASAAQWTLVDTAALAGLVPRKGAVESSMSEHLNLDLYSVPERAFLSSEIGHAQVQQPTDSSGIQNPNDANDQECSSPLSLNGPSKYRSRSASPNPKLLNAMATQSKCGRKRRGNRISKSRRSTESCTVRDAGAYWVEEKGPIRVEKAKANLCLQCPEPRYFARPEHFNRHMGTHNRDAPVVTCPLCETPIKLRKDNLKAHVMKTHFKPCDKRMTEKMNARWTIKDLFELFQNPLSQHKRVLWMDFFHKRVTTGSPQEIWQLVRVMDTRVGRLLTNEMTVHDREHLRYDKPEECTGKLTKFWTMLGWSIAETKKIRVKEVAPDWEGPEQTTLWDLDPRRKALEDGTMKVEDAHFLGISIFESRELGLEHADPRWRALCNGQTIFGDLERHEVKHPNPRRKNPRSKRKRSPS
ncbi:MAG: hypothetical protein Q9163_001142 [Psora crenata]